MATTERPEKSNVILDATARPATNTCWSCGAMRAAHYCQQCGKVQPPAPVDYFTFFGLLQKLNLDTAGLERDFYALSRKLHPDLNAKANMQEQEWSLEKTSQLNDAYRTLKDPVSRTEYLLRLHGVQLEEQSQAATEEARKSGTMKKPVVPPDLLEEVFELNMQLEELRMEKKMGEDDPELARELQKTKHHLEEKQAVMLGDLFKEWEGWDGLVDRAAGEAISDADRKAALDALLAVLNRRAYIRNLLHEIDEVLES